MNNTVNAENITFENYFHTFFGLNNTLGAITLNNFNSGDKGHITYNLSNSSSSLNFQNINFGNNDSRLYLISMGTTRSQLQSLNNCNFTLYDIFGYWNINMNNDFIIPQGSTLLFENKADVIQLNDIEFTTPHKFHILGNLDITGSVNLNRDILIDLTGICKIRPFDDATISQNYIKFAQNSGILCNGKFDASGLNDSIYMTVNGPGKWNGIKCLNNLNFTLNNIKVRNALSGIEMSKPESDVFIENSRFSDNQNYDIYMDNLHADFRATRLIKNNIFTGNPYKQSSVLCNNGLDIRVENNQFDEDYSLGISLLWLTNPIIKQNLFKATTTAGYSPNGIYSYSSGGFISCNDITNYSNGIYLSNSSPFIYNNDIYNNGVGLFCEYSSNPILTPSYSLDQTLYIGGFNRIFNNLNEEIYCSNGSFLPLSMPVLSHGYNSIYDGNEDCLIKLGNITEDITCYAEENYWGGNDPQSRLCPEIVNYVTEPYLTEEPIQPLDCNPSLEFSDNSGLPQNMLLLGSANIDDFNGNINSAVAKYKLLIDPEQDIQNSFLAIARILYSISKDSSADFYALENYYLSLSNLYQVDTLYSRRSSSLSTLSDVEQPAFLEAIGEYQFVINNPINEAELHFAYIDQMRAFRLMLDSLLNGYGDNPMNFNMSGEQFKTSIEKVLNYELSYKVYRESKNKESMNTSKSFNDNSRLVSTISDNDKNIQLSRIKKSLGLENIDINQLNNTKKIDILNKLIAFKLYEISTLNSIYNKRPLDRLYLKTKKSNNLNNIPKSFMLYQNYPNPFNPISTIRYDIPKQSFVKITIFDILGREVKTMLNEQKEPGYYEVSFDGTNYSSGVYFYRINAGSFTSIKKMVLIK